MRGSGNYYDSHSGAERGVTKGGWTPHATPTPFGSDEPTAPLPAQLSIGQSGTPAPARRRRGLWLLFSLLALLLLLAGAAVFLRGGLPRPVLGIDRWQDAGEDYTWDDWPTLLEDTQVAPGPLDTGVTLSLSTTREQSLAPQDISQRVSPAVVGVRAMLENGASLGTGVIMSPDGYIITNAHVIAGARALRAVLSDASEYDALLVGYDASTDLAVLKIDAQALPAAEFGDSALLRVGDSAYAIGNPLGEELRGTMTDGIISAIDRNVEMDGAQMTLLQTTAALNSGSSGGALINAAGQVVGITNMKMYSTWVTVEGLGFAIPSATVKEVVDEIIRQGFYSGAPMLGVTVLAVPAQDGAPAGLYVSYVEPGSDARRKGVVPGDIITAVNGQTVLTADDLARIKAPLEAGDTLTLELWNGGLLRQVEVALVFQRELA